MLDSTYPFRTRSDAYMQTHMSIGELGTHALAFARAEPHRVCSRVQSASAS
jgi:hypothetical protein